MSETFYPRSTLPAPNDIVWCRFPAHADLGSPGPKPRPAIVLNVAVDEESGEGEAQVIYGTTKLKMLQRSQDFFVSKMTEMNLCGLNRATRFDLDLVAWLPWTTDWFDILSGYHTPTIGRLSDHAARLLQIELGYRRNSQLSADC